MINVRLIPPLRWWMIFVTWIAVVAGSFWWDVSETINLYNDLFPAGPNRDGSVAGHEAILKNHLNRELLAHAGLLVLGSVMLAITIKLLRQRQRERETNHRIVRASEEKYRMLFEGNPVPMWVYDMETLGFLAVNEFAVDQYGYSQEEFHTMTIRDIRPPEDVPYLQEVLRRELGKKRKVGTARHRRKDGTIIIVDITGHEILYEGKRAMLVLSKDITEQKLAEKKIEDSLREKSVLLTEIHHRVKNNMQLISSLLQLQSMKIEDEKSRAPFLECENRIHSMALAHEQLYHSDNMASIHFKEYLTSLVSYIFISNSVSSEDIRWEITGNDLFFGLDKAVPCGLLVAELVLNIIKHAFPENGRGRMLIALEKGDRHYTVKVSDDGVGIPSGIDPAGIDTIGLQLVNILARQLSGELKIRREAGSEFIIVFPS